MKKIQGGVTTAKGFLAAGVTCGLKRSGKADFGMLVSETPALFAGAFTRNLFCAAPVVWCQRILKSGKHVKGLAVNSGTANACTGKLGDKNAQRMAALAAKALACRPDEVLVASTGVIGRQLPMDKISTGITLGARALSGKRGHDFARAIMTTDLVSKEAAVRITVGGKPVTLGGCCKGSGMIHPNMATMLAFVTTDARIAKSALNRAFKAALAQSFNRITVDGDTSTNDSLFLLANGCAHNPEIKGGKALADFTDALTHVCVTLAKAIARDGEGATKLVSVKVTGAKTEASADRIARSICHSPLVKTALFGNDPNWGRILAAAGYAGVPFDPSRVSLHVCGVRLVNRGEPLLFDAAAVSKKMKAPELAIVVDLKAGPACAELFTCDFSYDYVKINAEYHT
ncbi:MAG: bifunctional glutamate N-acetyltransferase/amino-acid acetyltransferase ArgJ [Fibrobacterota bacterium]